MNWDALISDYTTICTKQPDVYSMTASVNTTISGKMLKTQCTFRKDFWDSTLRDDIKQRMVRDIVNTIIKDNCIEFTVMEDKANDCVLVNARIFATPDDQVRILRQAGY